jgi:excisionase family DNA binding protein
MEMLRLAVAAARLGVHPGTLRKWAYTGKITFVWVGRERRFGDHDLDLLAGRVLARPLRKEALYVRVSGSAGQESSLITQELELRQSAQGEIVKVFKDRASGLKENRPGLSRLLAAASQGEFNVVRVTHADRLARFGIAWLTALLDRDGIQLEVLYPQKNLGSFEELLDDFMALVASFAGRMYGIRSRQTKQRLLDRAKAKLEEV